MYNSRRERNVPHKAESQVCAFDFDKKVNQMDNTAMSEVTAEESVQIQKVIQQSLREIEQMRERM